MNASSEPFGLPNTAPEMARRFGMIMAGLGALIARRFLKMPHLSGFTLLLWGRLNRAVRRFHRALILPPRKVRAVLARADRGEDGRPRAVSLPAGRGWIVRELGWEAAAYRAHLEILLADPATQAALAARPELGRILRPICRMLGVAMPVAAPEVAVVAETPVVVPPDPVPRIWPRLGVAGLEGRARERVVRAKGKEA